MNINTASGDGQKLPDQVLRVVALTERQKDVALLMVGAMLGSFRLPVSKEDYRGDKIEALPHPAYNVLTEGIQRAVDGWIGRNGAGRSFKNALLIRPDRFQLVYRGADKEPDRYDLTIQATISRKPDSAGFLSWGHSLVCTSSDHQSDWTLADWRANDNEKISAFIHRFKEECVATVEAQLDKLLAP